LLLLLQYLGGAMTGMTNFAKKGETDEFCSSVQSFSSSVCGLTEASVQVMYQSSVKNITPARLPGTVYVLPIIMHSLLITTECISAEIAINL
jgi:hypothetical protein